MMKRRALFASLALITALPVLAEDFHVPGANRLDFLTGYLGLTDQQKASAKTIFDAADAATTTAEGQLTAAAGTIEGTILAIHAKAETKFYALLTADQKTKYDAFERRTGPGPGGPGKH
jgi:hypothetical protein